MYKICYKDFRLDLVWEKCVWLRGVVGGISTNENEIPPLYQLYQEIDKPARLIIRLLFGFS